MATIQKRLNADGTVSYRAMVRKRGFPHLSETFSSKTRADAWAKRMEVAIQDGHAVSTEGQRTTLGEALERYKREETPKKKGAKRELQRVQAWARHPLSLRFLAQLRGSDFAKYRDERREGGKAENTIAIELKLISKLYKIAARDWGMEGLRNPIASMTMPGPSRRRERRVQPDEEKALLGKLEQSGPYMAPLAALAIETAMRQGELLALTWSDVDLQKRVAKLRDTKNGEARDVPLSTKAVDIIKALPRQLDTSAPLFPLTKDKVIHAFRQACMEAGVENLHFHDLRHEAVSRICDRLPMHEAMRVSGHKTPAMLMRYYHPKAEDLARKLA
jgi:integrase